MLEPMHATVIERPEDGPAVVGHDDGEHVLIRHQRIPIVPAGVVHDLAGMAVHLGKQHQVRRCQERDDARIRRCGPPKGPPPDWLDNEVRSQSWNPGLSTEMPSAEWQYQTLPAQRTFHSDLQTRFKGYSGPIGSGKSYALVYEALFLSRMNPGLLGLVGAPTYRMLQDSTQRTFFEVLQAEGIEYTFNKQRNHLKFPANGSEVIFRTMETPERLRGVNLAWFALDELTYTREEAWTRVVGRLRHPEARRLCGCAVWTPKGYDWVHERFVEQQHSDYRLVQATPRENIHLPADFYDQLKECYAERFYRQEALGEYLDVFGGNAYYAFSEENVRPYVDT